VVSWKIEASGLKVTIVPVSVASPILSNGLATCPPFSKRILNIPPSL